MNLVINNDEPGDVAENGEREINTNSIETQVLADNGQTVVLGGILKSIEESREGKTPFLGDLPVIGNLFKYSSVRNEKAELLVFITPRILDDGVALR